MRVTVSAYAVSSLTVPAGGSARGACQCGILVWSSPVEASSRDDRVAMAR